MSTKKSTAAMSLVINALVPMFPRLSYLDYRVFGGGYILPPGDCFVVVPFREGSVSCNILYVAGEDVLAMGPSGVDYDPMAARDDVHIVRETQIHFANAAFTEKVREATHNTVSNLRKSGAIARAPDSLKGWLTCFLAA